MPRGGSNRGGVRTGTPGTAYSNRSDLNANSGAPLPVQTAPSTQYGQAAASAASQQAVPMAPQPGPPPPTAAPAPIAPGSLGDPLRPTDRPGEPVTAGLPMGPGPNSVPTPTAPSPVLAGLALLNTLGTHLPVELQALRNALAVSQNNGMQ